jgi:putative phosphoribosyl transferase
MNARFRNRADAGRILAQRLKAIAADDDVIVLALPRGGVPIGYEVAQALTADLDVFLVRKLGVPGHEEFALGALAGGGVRVLNEPLIQELGLSRAEIDNITAREQREIQRRETAYRQGRRALPLACRTVVLVDDGLATGSTMLAAVRALRAYAPARIIVAVPIAAPEVCEAFRDYVDEIVCVETPEPFYAVGLWYEDFSQTTDEEVRQLLDRARRRPAA